jgi:hypothetical protein
LTNQCTFSCILLRFYFPIILSCLVCPCQSANIVRPLH